ncbi:MAG: nucleotide exchange factor GrpE [Dehalococcoidales bacterium]
MEHKEEADLNGELAPELPEEEDIVLLKKALAEEREKSESNYAGWQRAQADLVNYKRRAEQEKEDVARYGNTCLILGILPVIDDLERALDSVPENIAGNEWVEGIRLIERKLKANMESQGLSPVKALGESFDPNYHEAVMQGKGKDGMVIDEVEKGYMLKDRLIRPSKVVVGGGEEKEE